MKKFLSLAFLLTLTTPTFAHASELFAYLDPGSISLFLQILAVGFLGIMAFFSQIKTQVAVWMSRKKTDATSADTPSTIPMRTVNSEANREDCNAA